MSVLNPTVVQITIDQQRETLTVSFANGRELVARYSEQLAASFPKVAFEPSFSRLHLTTADGHLITAELPSNGDLAPLAERPIVYLDQNHWSTVANVLYGDTVRVRPAEAEAARHLIGLVLHRHLILPMSAAHVLETTKWTDLEGRRRLARTLATLSSGWVMRNPLAVRRSELGDAWARRYGSRPCGAPPVFSLDPVALFADSTETSSDFPEDEPALLPRAVAIAIANLDTLVDSESVLPGNPLGWVERLQQFTESLASESVEVAQRRQRTDVFFLADILKELTEEAPSSGLSREQIGEWLRLYSAEDLRITPALGLFREVLHEKLVNSQTRWWSNDLNDIMFLTCASAYADRVVAERSFSAQILAGLRRLGRPLNVHRTLVELLESLEFNDDSLE